ncbi:hypothetical protein C8Q75DRAFT_811982 [Abortiporus biennis]|nr:hypothetical protein C8Q75DRAFT_811982 [Abortiporus biennis]
MSDPDYIASVSTLPNRGVLETVYTLDLTSDGGIKSIDSLCYTFPNLRRLNISISGSTVYREAAEGDSEENSPPITLQAVKVRRWEALQKLIGNCDQLHALGLTCHVEHIRFRDLDGPFGDRFSSICDTCRPKAVTLYSPRLASFLKEKKSGRTSPWSFFNAPYLQSVTIKWLDRLARGDEVPGNTSNFQEQFHVNVVDFLQYVLASTSIEELFLECFVKKWSKSDTILQYLETTKQETFIRGIADAIPSLQRVAFSIEFSWIDMQKSFWCISREDGGEVLLRRPTNHSSLLSSILLLLGTALINTP